MTGSEPWLDALGAAARDADVDSGIYEVDGVLDALTEDDAMRLALAATVLSDRAYLAVQRKRRPGRAQG